MNREPVIGVLLAAGRGRRYDPSGQRLKLLQPAAAGPHAGLPLAVASARTLAAAVDSVVAVVRPVDGPQQAQLQALLRAEGCHLEVCSQADAGMGHSLAAGVAASADARAWVIALADMPAVAPATVAAVVAALRAGATAARPVVSGVQGHPVGFSAASRDALLALTGDTGARAVLHRYPPHLIDCDDRGALLDVDHA